MSLLVAICSVSWRPYKWSLLYYLDQKIRFLLMLRFHEATGQPCRHDADRLRGHQHQSYPHQRGRYPHSPQRPDEVWDGIGDAKADLQRDAGEERVEALVRPKLVQQFWEVEKFNEVQQQADKLSQLLTKLPSPHFCQGIKMWAFCWD